jgi:hypothetical protein
MRGQRCGRARFGAAAALKPKTKSYSVIVALQGPITTKDDDYRLVGDFGQ